MFLDRSDAGRALAAALHHYPRPNPAILALPRGGLPVAEPVAEELDGELDVIVVRKLGAPFNRELAIGAVGEQGVAVLDVELQRRNAITSEEVAEARTRESAEVERRLALYRHDRRPVDLANRNVVIVDDGLATGSTALAAVEVARRRGAAHITVAVPVGSHDAVALLAKNADEVVCLEEPDDFMCVGAHYRGFDQVDDEEVVRILARHPLAPCGDRRATTDQEVLVRVDGLLLPGHLAIPSRPKGIVVFAHGSGSSRRSPRNQSVAQVLRCAGMGTLLFDLLGDSEARDRANVFDIELLADRLIGATHWVAGQELAEGKPVGYFGASTGAAAALVAAAKEPTPIRAIVSRGGRPDLAGGWLEQVRSPTLLIVGGSDHDVLELNRQAAERMSAPTLISVVPGAGHLFEEPGTLAQVARLAQSWFAEHL